MPLARRSVLAGPLLASPFLATPFLAGAARADCTRIAEVPLRLVEGYLLVSAMLAGQAVSLLLDTGAQGMLIEPSVAQALGLPLRGMTRIFGTGGSRDAPMVLLPGLRLGGAAMPAQIAPVAPLPISLRTEPALAGLLGASLLSRFDLDLDIRGGRMSLLEAGGCAPFAGHALPMRLSQAGEAFVPVRVNGQQLVGEVDTGSRATLLTVDAARYLGVDAPISANTAPGIDGQRLPLGHLRVRFAFGDATEADTPVSIAPVQIDGGDMLLGLDQLARQRLWIGYAARQLILGLRPPA